MSRLTIDSAPLIQPLKVETELELEQVTVEVPKILTQQEEMYSELQTKFEDDVDEDNFKPFSVGVCAMHKKTMAKPMQSILSRVASYEYIQVVMFSDDMILNKPVEEWPICECLIAFYSDGFPLDKAIAYVELRKPMVFNDLQEQYSLMDRQKVYEILTKNGVEVPRYVVLDRSQEESSTDLVETDDVLEVGGQVFHKPFVEKPLSAEDHNIYIYFPSDYGGGSQRLFRKVKNRSSSYSKESSIRKNGSYIYEEFLATDGTDVKVYVVGPDYAHAEARKSPALDGKVERDGKGKEVRHPVILNAKEKLIARKVCQAFKQTVCGFDLLRANGKSIVCDVNGFSFVKNSQKYYDDCAQILLEMVTASLAPQIIPRTPPSVEYLVDEVPEMPIPIPKTGNTLELRCVVGVIRHGDRTPKQKMKMVVTHWRFIQLFRELDGFKKAQIKIKKPKLLQRVLDISRYLLEDIKNSEDHSAQEIAERKLLQLRAVLEMYGTFSGINRKVQFKLLNKNCPNEEPRLLLILKWGGELTPTGQRQAEELGRAFRCMYPGGEGEYASLPGSGFLRLHSTYRHDLKVYASDEGRVQMTAAAFTKGLLDLEGNLASTLVHIVRRDQAATNMLDTSTDAQEAMENVKERLHTLMRSTSDFTPHSYTELAPTEIESIVSAMKIVLNPSVMNERLHENVSVLLDEIKQLQDSDEDIGAQLYQDETLPLMINRWAKLVKDFKSKRGKFDISKIPDIYDCIKYDMLHNRCLRLKSYPDVARCAMPLADIVIPQEYGITEEEKFDIGKKICTPLLRKIQADFHHTIVNESTDILHRLDARLSTGVVSPNRHVRSRLYFTSESHVHSLVNILRHGGLDKYLKDGSVLEEALKSINESPELNYMTQIVFMLYEDTSKDPTAKDRFCVEIRFSPGVKSRQEIIEEDNGSITPTNSQTDLLKKHSPDLPKPLIFVKRLPHAKLALDHHAFSKLLHLSPKVCDGEDQDGPRLQSRRVSTSVLESKSDPHLNRPRRNVSIPCTVNSALVEGREAASSPTDDDSPSKSIRSQNSLSSSSDSSMYAHSMKLSEGSAGSPPDSVTGTAPVSHYDTGSPVPPRKALFTVNPEESGGSPPITRDSLSLNLLEERAPGLELATELASTVQPLISVCSAPLPEINNFFTSLTNVELNFDPIIPDESDTANRSRSNTPVSNFSKEIGTRLYRKSKSERSQSAAVALSQRSARRSIPEAEMLHSDRTFSEDISSSKPKSPETRKREILHSWASSSDSLYVCQSPAQGQ